MKFLHYIFYCMILFCLLMILSNNIIITSVKAEEYDNYDTMNNHPASRWTTDLATSTSSLAVDNGILTYADNATGVTNASIYSRDIMQDDFIMEGRIKTPSASAVEVDMLRYFEFEDTDDMVCIDSTGTQNGTYLDFANMNYQFQQSSFDSFFDYAVHFNDSSSQVEFAHDDDWHFGSVSGDLPFSVSMWLYNWASDWAIDAGADWEFNYVKGAYDYLYFYIDGVGGSLTAQANLTAFELNDTWTFFSCTYDGSESSDGMNIYINGINRTDYRTETGTYAGMSNYQLDKTFFFYNNTVDELILWDSELSNTAMYTLYENYIGSHTDIVTSDCMIGFYNQNEVLDPSAPPLAISFTTTNLDFTKIIVYYIMDSYRINPVNLTSETWYYFKITVNLASSYVKFELKTDALAAITGALKTNLDITSISPTIFAASRVNAYFGNYHYSKTYVTWWIDYLNAPYGEYKFKTVISLDDADVTWISDSAFGSQYEIEDDAIAAYRVRSLSVPRFDSCSGYMNIEYLDYTYSSGTLGHYKFVEIGQFNPETGAYVAIGGYDVRYVGPVGGFAVFTGNHPYFSGSIFFTAATAEDSASTSFCIYKDPNQETNLMILQIVMDESRYTFDFDAPYNSTEFGIRTGDIISNGAGTYDITVQTSLSDFELTRANIFGFIASAGTSLFGGILKLLFAPMLIGFRFLGGIFKKVMTPILAILGTILTPLLGMLETLAGLAAQIGTAIWNTVIAELSPILTEIFSVLLTIISTLTGLAIAFVVWIWDNTVEAYFPGVGDLFFQFVGWIGILITWAGDALDFVIQYQFFFYCLLTAFIFIGAAVISTDLLDFVLNVVDTMKINTIQGLAVIGISISVPLGVIWFLLTVFWWSA